MADRTVVIEARFPYSYQHVGKAVSFDKGERFLLLEKSNNDWWKVRRGGRGRELAEDIFVPVTYVREVESTLQGSELLQPTAVTLNSSSVTRIPTRVETAPTEGARTGENSQSASLPCNSDSNLRHTQTLPHCRNEGEAPASLPNFSKKKLARPVLISPLCSYKVTKLSIVKENEKAETESTDCCFRSQPSADTEQSTSQQHHQPNHPHHVVRSFTLPNRIHPNKGAGNAQEPPPSSMKIRRNCSKRIITEMKSSDQVNQHRFFSRSSLIPIPRSSSKRDIRRVFSISGSPIKVRQEPSHVVTVSDEPGPTSPTWASMTLKHGYLHKKKVCDCGGKKTKGEKWLTVFTVLQNKQLSFFKDHKEQDQSSGKLGMVHLEQAMAEMVDSKEKKKVNVIQVESSSGEVIHLYADSQQETDHWFTLVQRCVPPVGVKFELTESRGKSSVSRKSSSQSVSSAANEDEDNSEKTYLVKNRLKRFLSKRPKPEQLKTGIVRYSIFGGSLQELVETEGSLIPGFILYFINHIEQHGLDIMGIYRLSGNAAMVQKLRFLVEKNEYRVLHKEEWSDINVVTGCLKLYFRELEEPLIPSKHYPALVDLLRPSLERSLRIEKFKEELQKLPEANYQTLKVLLKHLAKVASCSEANMMQPGNLGIVFGPTLLRVEAGLLTMASLLPTHGTVVELLIMYQEEVFDK